MKLKKFPILLLAAGLLLLGAWLPRLVGSLQDAANVGKIEYPQLSQIHLEITDRDAATLSTAAKLSLLRNTSNSLELPDSMAKTSKKKLLQVAQDWAEQYYRAGLLPSYYGFDSMEMSAQAYLIYQDSQKTRSNIYWRLEFTLPSAGTAGLIVDDETHTILYGGFTDLAEPDAEGYLTDVDGAMERFCSLYLENLGTEFEKYDAASIAKSSERLASYEGDLTYRARRAELRWGDILYGETTVLFLVDPHGFYTVIL